MKVEVAILFGVVCLCFQACEGSLAHSMQLAQDVTLSWTLDKTANAIVVTMEVDDLKGWVALGLHCSNCSNDKMLRADIIVGIFDSAGQVTVSDRFSTNLTGDGTGQPLLDTQMGGKNNIIRYSGVQMPTYTSMTFERALVTNDTVTDWPIIDGDLKIIWAHGNPSAAGGANTFQYHGTYCGQAVVNFFQGSGDVQDLNTIRYWHATLMIAAFGVFMSFGIFVARYLKEYYWWFPLHIIAQVLGVVLAVVGFGLAVNMTPSQQHFTNIHSWFGISVLALAFIAPSMGWASHLVYNPGRNKTPVWPDKLHWWSGRFTVLLAYVTIILGMRQLQASIVFQWGFGMVVVLYLAIYSYLEVYRWKNSSETVHEPNHHTKLLEK